jgi:hypothetical protein
MEKVRVVLTTSPSGTNWRINNDVEETVYLSDAPTGFIFLSA